MAKTYPVKFFGHDMQGAPQLTADTTQGQMSALLKAVLVDGFGSLVPTTIIYDEDLGWAKATFASGHAYQEDSIIACSGALPTDYNGEHRIMKIDTTNVWFELDTVPVSAATGESLEIRIAPLGWELMFSDEANEVMIFKAGEDLGNVHFRIDNSAYSGWYNNTTYARWCKVAMVEDVVDIDTYTTIYSHYWAATDYRSSGGGWNLVGDNRIFYHMMKYGAGNEFGGFVAGYIDSIRAGDRYHFIMNHLYTTDIANGSSNEWDQTDSANHYYAYFLSNNSTSYRVIARPYHQLEGTTGWKKRGMGSYGCDMLLLPNPTDNGFYFNTEPQMVQESSGAFRGYMPLLIEPLANNTALYKKNLKNLPNYPNKIFRMLLTTYKYNADGADVLCGFDISTVEV